MSLAELNKFHFQSPKLGSSQTKSISRSRQNIFSSSKQLTETQQDGLSSLNHIGIGYSENGLKVKIEIPQDSPSSLDSYSNRQEIFSKITDSINQFEEEEDEDIMNRLTDIIEKRQSCAQKPKTLTSEIERSREIEVSPIVQRNIDLVKRISKFRDFKGIKSSSKEVKFESLLKEFKRVKTFIKIHDIIKDVSETVQTGSDSHLRQSSFKKQASAKQVLNLTKHAGTYTDNKFGNELNSSPEGDSSPPVSKRKSSFRLEPKLKPIEGSEGIELIDMKEMYEQLKENIIKQIGIDAFRTIETALGNPKKQKEVQNKVRAEVKRLRELKEKLRNFDVFHSLIDYLTEDINPKFDGVTDVEGGRVSPFYEMLEGQLKHEKPETETSASQTDFKDDEKTKIAQELHQKMHLRALLLKQEMARKKELAKSNTLIKEVNQNLIDYVDDDRQLKMANYLSAYKERSNKVIKMLKRKTIKLGRGNSKIEKAHVEDTKAKLQNIIEQPLESLITLKTGTPDLPPLSQPSEDDSNKRNFKRRLQMSSTHMYSTRTTKVSMFSPQYKLLQEPDSASAVFQNNVISNRKHYFSHRKLMKSTLPDNSSDGSSIYPSSSRKTQFFGTQVKNKTHHLSFGKSIDGIQGMLTDLSMTNREFKTQLNTSKEEIGKFYKSKIGSMQKSDVPESLKIQVQVSNAKNNSAKIMRITKKVLQDIYDT